MTKNRTTLPTAVVLKLGYAGLGVVRSLSAHGIPVIALSYRGAYGMFTRRAKILACPDSRENSEGLLEVLLRIAKGLDSRPVLFPTSDDNDLVFVDRFREQLEPYYAIAIAGRSALHACVNKWETYRRAIDAGVPVPRTWIINGPEEVERVSPEATFPCVLKPVASYYWKKAGVGKLLNGRKAYLASSPKELRNEYAVVARADGRVLIQQLIPGGDDAIVVAACYLDRNSNLVAGFYTQKLTQYPPGFGSGCIVQLVDLPELREPTRRLLQQMRFTGIAGVEYKWDQATGQYMLIEVNCRPWDQHRLGIYCGVDLAYLAYCELAGLPLPPVRYQPIAKKWVSEDKLVRAIARRLWNREPGIGVLMRLLKGKRVYAIWDWSDPLPAIAYFTMRFLPDLAWSALRRLWFAARHMLVRSKPGREEGIPCTTALAGAHPIRSGSQAGSPQ